MKKNEIKCGVSQFMSVHDCVNLRQHEFLGFIFAPNNEVITSGIDLGDVLFKVHVFSYEVLL